LSFVLKRKKVICKLKDEEEMMKLEEVKELKELRCAFLLLKKS